MRSLLRAHASRNRDDGAAAVEFALIFSLVLAPALLGIVAFGLAIYQQIGVGQLAREGARTAAICAGAPDATPSACKSEGESAAALTATSGFVGDLVSDSPSLTHYGCDGDPGDVGYSVTMTVTVKPLFPIPDVFGIELVNDLTGKATTPCGG